MSIANDLPLANLNGIRLVRRGETIFIPLPRALWRSCGTCDCPHCKGAPAFWDTLALAATRDDTVHNDHTWTVHGPEFQPK